jgi:RNA-directed DNA polymerase
LILLDPPNRPESSGNGTRTLSIPTIPDRVVQRAIVQIGQPYLDPNLSPYCFGYRPGRKTLQALAQAERLAKEGGLWTWLTEDVRDAFDNVPQSRLLDIVRKHLPVAPMMDLLKLIVTTERTRGLRQGGCLSPLLLNLYLDHFLDRPMTKERPCIPLIRFADDLLVLCRDREEAQDVYKWMAQKLQAAAMPLKRFPQTSVHRLDDGHKVDWLGYRLTKDGDSLSVSIAEKAWDLHLVSSSILL